MKTNVVDSIHVLEGVKHRFEPSRDSLMALLPGLLMCGHHMMPTLCCFGKM